MTTEQPTVVLLEANAVNLSLIRETLESSGFRVVAVRAPGEVAVVLEEVSGRLAALLDTTRFDGDFREVCRLLRNRAVPFVVVVPKAVEVVLHAGISQGAFTVVTKPLSRKQLISVARALTEGWP